jgi:hypothetical protein
VSAPQLLCLWTTSPGARALGIDFMAPHRHLVVDVTVTSARKSTNVSRVSASLPLPGSLALEAQHIKLDADLRTSALDGSWYAFGSFGP